MEAEQDEQLMAVLLGEPSPTGGGSASERHAAAERDMAVVREQLLRIGDGLARKAAATAPQAPAQGPRPRRMRRGVLVLAASVVVALVGAGAAYFAAHNGDVDGSGAEARLTDEGLIACSTTVAEGTVARVEQVGGAAKFRIVLDVDRYYKPESGKRELAFTDEGPDVKAYYGTGTRMLVVVSRFPAEGPQTFRQGDPTYSDGRFEQARDALEWGRQWVAKALPGAQGRECPVG